jgi:hypothetical protein
MITNLKKWTTQHVQLLRDRLGCRLLGVRELPKRKMVGERVVVDLSPYVLRAARDYARDFPCTLDEVVNIALESSFHRAEYEGGRDARKC